MSVSVGLRYPLVLPGRNDGPDDVRQALVVLFKSVVVPGSDAAHVVGSMASLLSVVHELEIGVPLGLGSSQSRYLYIIAEVYLKSHILQHSLQLHN